MRPYPVDVSQTFNVDFQCNHAQGEPTERCVIQCVGNSSKTILTVCLGVFHHESGNWDTHQHKTITTWLLDPGHPPSDPPPPYSEYPPSMPDGSLCPENHHLETDV